MKTTTVAFWALLAVLLSPLNAAADDEGGGEGGEEGGVRYAPTETAREVRNGVELVLAYDATRETFTGSVTNTTNAMVTQVRVEVHLSNGVELGPTPRADLEPGEQRGVELDARGQSFTWFSTHVEMGPTVPVPILPLAAIGILGVVLVGGGCRRLAG